MTELGDCAFCKPDELDSRRLSAVEDPFVISFLSKPRMTPGHSLVVPRRHVDPAEGGLNNAEAEAMEREVERLRRLMLGRLAFDGVDVWQKTRPAVQQGHNGTKMDHIHYHVLPSREGDELYESAISWGSRRSFSPLEDEEASVMIEALRV